MKQLKTIEEIPQYPMDAWEVADYLFGKKAVADNHSLASKAAQQMKAAGWNFSHYNDFGEEVHEPPAWTRALDVECPICEAFLD